MKFLTGIISEARRPVGDPTLRIQRSELAAETSPAPMAPPVEEQDNGAYTIYRFQKEGAARPQEASDGGRSTRSDSVAMPASPLVPGGSGTSPPSVIRQSEESISVEGNVDESIASKQSDLTTGKAYDVVERSSFESESTGSSEVSRFQLSNEQTLHSTVTGSQSELVTQQNSQAFEHEVEQRFIRRIPGDDAPSEPNRHGTPPRPTQDRPAAVVESAITAATDDHSPDTPAPIAEVQVADPGWGESPQTMDSPGRWNSTGHMGSPGHRHDPGWENRSVTPTSNPTPPPSQAAVMIGRVDVVVVSEPSPTAPASGGERRNFLSRNYLRRL